MKAKYTLIALLAIALFSCDDNTGGVGMGMFPGSDLKINGKLTTFDVTTESVHAGQIYAKSNIGYVGKFTDDRFGTYQAGFLTELNCPKGMTFPKVFNGTALDKNNKVTQTMVGTSGKEIDKEGLTFIEDSEGNVIGNIHTIELYLWYDSYFGDSLTASRLSVYELNKNLETSDAYYTNINPKEYYDQETEKSLLGTKAYTAVDLSVSDSIRNLSTYSPSVHISFKDEAVKRIGAGIIQAAYKAGANLDNETFRKIFRGIYVENDYGDGTILYINQVQMNVVYKCYAVDTLTGSILTRNVVHEGETTDSTYYGYRMFTSTREVIQANRLHNDDAYIQKCIDDPNCTYIKSPAGIFTQVTLPIGKIAEELQGDTLNAVKLSIPIYNETNNRNSGMSVPRSVLLIRKKHKDTFFEKNQLSDGITSVLFDNSSTTGNFTEYTYNNITQLVNNCLADRKIASQQLPNDGSGSMTIQVTNDEGETETKTVHTLEEWEANSDWNKVVLIPVLVSKDTSSSDSYSYYYGSSTSSQIISIQHDLKPSYARLKGGTNPDNVLKLEVISTNFETKTK